MNDLRTEIIYSVSLPMSDGLAALIVVVAGLIILALPRHFS